MVQKNGYFDVEFKEDGAVCHLYPPSEGGIRVEYRDLTSYLDAHGFSYNSRELNATIFSEGAGSFALNPTSLVEFSESMYVEVSEDQMQAVCRFYPGSKNGAKLVVKDILASLNQKGVVFGIDQDLIMDFLKNPVYCQDVVLASGTAPIEGHDASIEYFFNTNPNTKPAYNEDGSVDFHSLDIISQVSKDQILARLTPEDHGKSGRSVTGHDIAPRPVKGAYLQVGKNISLSTDRTEAISDVTGHACLIKDQIFVSDVYEVPADVDNSTGDIQYNGNVHVKGSIREGFTVNAQGDVIVDGTVEGALVIAGGQIVIKRGVNGMNKGVLEAKGCIISKFIENTKAFAGGYVESGSIIHSAVSAKGDVVVNDKKGFITGSVVRSGGKVEAHTIGSAMGSATKIEIGIDPSVKEEYLRLEEEIKKMNSENQKIVPIVGNYKAQMQAGVELDPKNKEYYIKLKQILVHNKETLEKDMEAYEGLKQQLTRASGAKVVVSRDIFPGVTIICSDSVLTIKDKRSYCSILKKDGEMIIQNL